MNNLSNRDFKICIVGLGYVGLPLAARFAIKKFDIIGYDVNHERVKELQKNKDILKVQFNGLELNFCY